ncbi:hypothetical protein [Mucilaginibacter celer]|uniref:Uncharacterized protein n=1 Tax=Mucilaginibacter celer TaxID=2305508 RepID=A0A494VNR4_9SPHI|nr:hypothetical protein [Mucilaginibacter celer]AYL95391.1 hypothetical protein HYN43_008835 [Mucilaginibacter celer]
MDKRLKVTPLITAMAGNVYGAAEATAAGKTNNPDGLLIIAVLIILGLAGTIGLLIYALTRIAGKARPRFTKNSLNHLT